MFKKILQFSSQHKVAAAAITIVIIGAAYYSYSSLFANKSQIRYTTAKVEKGTLIVSVSNSGQTSVSNQMDIKPKVSGDIIYLAVKNGDEVKAGTLLAQIDASDAQKTVRDAEANFEAAKLSLEKLKQPADQLSILQAEDALAQAKESKQKAENDLKKAYDNGFNTIADAFLNVPTVMTGLKSILFDQTINRNQDNVTWYLNQINYQDSQYDKAVRYKNDIYNIYNKSLDAYTKNFDNYKLASRASDPQTIETLILETYETTKTIADTVKTINNYIDFVQDFMAEHKMLVPSAVLTHQSNLDSYTNTTNNHLTNLLSVKQTIEDTKRTIINDERSIAEKTESLAKLRAGADALDIQSAELSLKQRENALLDAKEKFAYYFIHAPFNGVVTKINVKKGDPVSPSTVISTFITKQRLAEISLNEIDAAKIKIGQKATIIFDAISGLTISGQVTEIDSIGTITQGVVTYGVKIAFDTQDERVKPGMSVSVAVITDIKQDILMVPNSAIKQQGDANYVEIFTGDNQTPQQQIVQTGLFNDTMTEIVSGLKENDQVITQTITTNNTSASQNQTQRSNSSIRIPGIGGFGR